MNNRFFKVIKFALFSSLIGLVSCGNSGYKGEEPVFDDIYEDDYTYMWHRDGIVAEQDRMMFQSTNYGMLVDSKTGKIVSYSPYDNEHLESFDISTLNNVHMQYNLIVDGNECAQADISPSGRMIASGRYFNKWDNISIRYKGQGAKYYGRTEFVGTRNFVALNYELIAEVAGTYGLSYSLSVDGYTVTKENNVIKAIDSNGNGFYLVSNDSGVILDVSNDVITVTASALSISKTEFKGFSTFLIPIKTNSKALLDGFNSLKNMSVTAKTVHGDLLPVSFNSKNGTFVVDIHEMHSGSAASDGAYDIVNFEIKNETQTNVEPVIIFEKDSNVSITGVSGIIRDSETLEPTGEQVQISKNWHAFKNLTDAIYDYAKINNQGSWCSGIVSLNCPANSVNKRQYVQIYGKWGNTYAASHGQLCLIGWGGNQLWDQSAMGSWGESTCYDPDINLSRAIINDVRPFLVTGPTGGNAQFNWSGNVGGADFLNYRELFDEKIVNQRVSYKSQGPNITDVLYSGVTSDGKIKTNININLGRTDDIVRNIYTIDYTFLQDVTYSRLSLFKVAADNYSDNLFTNYCIGDSKGLIETDKDCMIADIGYMSDPINVKNSDFFFGTYNSSDVDEYGDPMMCVREFNAYLNGKTYDKPAYQLFGTNDSGMQVTCEITVPKEVSKTIKRGSKISLTVEYAILPNNMSTYYGMSDYILASNSIMGTGEAMYQQAVGGKVSVTASKGSVKANKPVIIECENDEAEFTINGGLGYVPLFINNVNGYKGYSLEKKVNGSWEKVDQSVLGNDYYSVRYDAKIGKYQFAYNVKNTNGLNFGMSETYRFVKNGN